MSQLVMDPGFLVAIGGVFVAAPASWYAYKMCARTFPKTTSNNAMAMPETAASRSMDDLDVILASKRIRIGCVCYPPLLDFRHVDHRLEVFGLYGSILQRVAEENELGVEYVPLAWHQFKSALENRRVDLIL